MYKIFIAFLLILCFGSCKSQINQNKPMKTYKYTNDLIHETSPYLLQHAHNPVNWKPWKPEILEQAKKENKLLIISIGYAACHWCHVMEHESFEDTTVAKLMNENFISIKIDREERPDVDQVYMTAVQMMTGRGGWPMNVVALPDGRPVWGGTYFPKDRWMSALKQIAEMWKNQPGKLIEYANGLTEKVKQADIINVNNDETGFTRYFIKQSIEKWERNFDHRYGGSGHAPKFPLPGNYQLLQRYAYQVQDKDILKFTELTLEKMAFGGTYDHVGGGFARYSTDDKWHIPHFEKMLYDNGQLVSLYSSAYALSKKELYKEVVYETLEFVERELTGDSGNFYSSLDADSEDEHGHLEEGAYYVWKKDELKSILGGDFELFKEYYNINNYGKWEKGTYVLIKDLSDEEFSEKYNISVDKLKEKVKKWKEVLLKEREKRSSPRLDDKTLTSWNALMLKGYIDAYKAFGEKHFLDVALKNAKFIVEKQMRKDGGLFHNYKNGTSNINAYLEDYSTVIDAFIEVYQVTTDNKWLNLAKKLTDYSFIHFFDNKSKMFFFTSDEDREMITRKIETYDGVIPSSNSIMANNLFKLSHYFEDKMYRGVAEQMLKNVLPQAKLYASGFSNWLNLYCDLALGFYEVVITGQNAESFLKNVNSRYLPNILIAASTKENDLPLFRNRFVQGKTLIYTCIDGTCKLPVDNVEDFLREMGE